MAFNPRSTADLTKLKNEIRQTRYTSLANDDEVIEFLNDPKNNQGGETDRPPLTLGALWDVVAANSETTPRFEFNISNLFSMMMGREGADTDISDRRALIIGLGNTQVNAALNALTRPLSRGEVLFPGTDSNGIRDRVVIRRIDLENARKIR